MIIKNITILNFKDLNVKKDVDVLIEGNRIKKIGKGLNGEGEVIDGSKFYLTPGVTNCHAHVAMTLLRGSAEDTTTLDWFNKHIWIYEKNLTPEGVYIGTLLGVAEMLLSGVTLVCDHYFYMDRAYKAYKESGIRADLAWAVFGTGEGWEEKFKEAMNFIEKYNGLDERLTISLGPHSPYICPEEFLKKIAEISESIGLKSHIHVSEEQWEIEKSLKEKGRTPIEYLKDIGILKKGTILAHAYFATDSDLDLIKNVGAYISHAPKTYMRFGVVKDLLPRAIKKGIKVSFASDGPASNSNINIFEVARDAALLAKVSTGNPETGRVEELIPLLSTGGEFIGREDIGEVKEGFIADLLLIKKDSPNMNPDTNIFANILYSLSDRDIDTVIVDGKIVVKNGKLLTIDVDEVVREANRIRDKMIVKRDERPMQTFGV